MIKKNKDVVVVDPGDAIPVLNFLKEKNLNLKSILITHKHSDHIGGIEDLLSHYPNIKIMVQRIILILFIRLLIMMSF